MRTETMLAIYDNLKKDHSQKQQQKQIRLLQTILKVNQDVTRQGLSVIENCEQETAEFPMLWKGLQLARNGMEPRDIESILLNTAFANEVDLMESLLIIDGVYCIQTMRSPDTTMEWLLSHFCFPAQEQLTQCLQDQKLSCCRPLSRAEIEELLKGQDAQGHRA